MKLFLLIFYMFGRDSCYDYNSEKRCVRNFVIFPAKESAESYLADLTDIQKKDSAILQFDDKIEFKSIDLQYIMQGNTFNYYNEDQDLIKRQTGNGKVILP